ncbi:hypothetical protein B0H13DRAFT_2659854 [Mycena leptocephala]|nr:hypothetical protein B0H13DRAFT_2659854 [Mycena leptocephala]
MRNGDASTSDGIGWGGTTACSGRGRDTLSVHAEPQRQQRGPVACRALSRVGERPACLIWFPSCVRFARMLRGRAALHMRVVDASRRLPSAPFVLHVTPLSFTAQTAHCGPRAAARPIRILVDAFPAQDALPRRGPHALALAVIQLANHPPTLDTLDERRQSRAHTDEHRHEAYARVGSLAPTPNTKVEHRCLPRHRSPSMPRPPPDTPHSAWLPQTQDPPNFVPSNLTHAGSDATTSLGAAKA